jgi:hypothetical protein
MNGAPVTRNESLSKSLFIRGLQCRKSLYLHKRHPELKDELSEDQQARFDSGHEVGRLARELFPGGREIPYEGLSYQKQLALTQEEIRGGAGTIYEAAFSHDGVFVKVDILHKGEGGWEIHEVKSSTAVKDVHVADAAVQYHVVTGSGLPVSKASLVYINNQYVRRGEIDVHNLFSGEDLTGIVRERQAAVAEEIAQQKEMLRGDEPAIEIGPWCDNPYACDFRGHCWEHIPADSVFDLRGRGIDRFWLYRKGFLSMYDVPEEYLKEEQRSQVRANRDRQESVDRAGVRSFLESIRYPLYYLDFETFMSPVPPYDGIRPYQQIPFQYSLHRQESPDGELEHTEYLGLPGEDPRQGLIAKLAGEIPGEASVLVYNKSFETGILEQLAGWHPEYASAVQRIIGGIIDLMEPFQNRSVYSWRMNGSYSLKSVLPALVPEPAYENLAIRDGGMAMTAYQAMNRSDNLADIARIRQDLLEYCSLDTLAMVKILSRLRAEGGTGERA